jgi:hypothetical protein
MNKSYFLETTNMIASKFYNHKNNVAILKKSANVGVMKFYALKEHKRGYNVMLKQNINNTGIQIWFLSFSHF